MKRYAKITVHGKDTSYIVRGCWERTAEGWLLSYDEPEATEMGAVRTELAIASAAACLTRTGAVRSELRFDPRSPHEAFYETPYGTFPTVLVTHSLRTRLGERGGLFEARYRLSVGGAVDEHELRVLIRTEEEA